MNQTAFHTFSLIIGNVKMLTDAHFKSFGEGGKYTWK